MQDFIYKVSASRQDGSKVEYYFHSKDFAMIKYNRLKNELHLANTRVFLVRDVGQKKED